MDKHFILHNGDNTDFVYGQIAFRHKVDLFLANSWSWMVETYDAVNPRLMVTGHENELGHDVAARVPYSYVFANTDRMGYRPSRMSGAPSIAVLGQGESLRWESGRGIASK